MLLVMLFLTPLFYFLPKFVLAAIVISSAISNNDHDNDNDNDNDTTTTTTTNNDHTNNDDNSPGDPSRGLRRGSEALPAEAAGHFYCYYHYYCYYYLY